VTIEHVAGALEFPVPGAEDDEAPGAPTLSRLLVEFRLAIETLCGEAWSTHYPAEPVVRMVWANDPTEGDFLANDLPALFLWGHDDQQVEQVADDIRVTTDNFTLMWLPHPAPDIAAKLTSQFWQAISKAIRLVSGKHGSGLHNTETTWGGDTITRLGLYDLDIGRGEPTDVRIQAGDETCSFTAVMWQVTVRESIGTPITSPAQPISAPAMRATYTTGGAEPLVVAESWHPKP
jgi:hypothetical protein